LECDDRWGAIALGDAGGFGVACGLSDRDLARMRALVVCLVAVKGYCRIHETFSGARQRPEEENHLFDSAVLLQATLSKAGHYKGSVDGVIGAETRAAVRSFQVAEGFSSTGALDDTEAERLVSRAGGADAVVSSMVEGAASEDSDVWTANAGSGKRAPTNKDPDVAEAEGEVVQSATVLGVSEAEIDQGLSAALPLINGNKTAPQFNASSPFVCRM